MRRRALAAPWCAALGLRPLLRLTLAEALLALADKATAGDLLATAQGELELADPYGLSDLVQAAQALMLAELGNDLAARVAATGRAGLLPAGRLARAVLGDHKQFSPVATIEQIVDECGADRSLRAQAQAHLARLYAREGRDVEARVLARRRGEDDAYPLTPRETTILGPLIRPPRGPIAIGAPPAAVRLDLHFFGHAAAFADGRPLGSAWWQQSKVRELFWYALAHGRDGFSRDEACAHLFPESDMVSAARALRNLLYELRRILRATPGELGRVAEHDRHVRCALADLAPEVTSDLLRLTEHRARLERGDLGVVSELIAGAAGRYLADIGADWTRPFRYYWEREAVEALDRAASLCERVRRPMDALACLQREVDFCADDALLVQRVLRRYAALGDAGGMRATYLQHRRSMRQELDADADPAVTALYQELGLRQQVKASDAPQTRVS